MRRFRRGSARKIKEAGYSHFSAQQLQRGTIMRWLVNMGIKEAGCLHPRSRKLLQGTAEHKLASKGNTEAGCAHYSCTSYCKALQSTTSKQEQHRGWLRALQSPSLVQLCPAKLSSEKQGRAKLSGAPGAAQCYWLAWCSTSVQLRAGKLSCGSGAAQCYWLLPLDAHKHQMHTSTRRSSVPGVAG
eukprot:1160660-Pelagomonas_calceolata.AAC.1